METNLAIGNRVSTTNGNGTVRFIGTTSFAEGKWIGVELDGRTGKNNGVVQGKAYFSCRAGYGVFVKPSGVKLLDAPSRRSSEEAPRTGRVIHPFNIHSNCRLRTPKPLHNCRLRVQDLDPHLRLLDYLRQSYLLRLQLSLQSVELRRP